MALLPEANTVVGSLLNKYGKHDAATLVGIYLRLFTRTEELMEAGWLDLNHIKLLKKLVLDPDFNVQSDALETMRVSCRALIGLGIVYFQCEIRPAQCFGILPRQECPSNSLDFQRH